jgi:hypothetical protein
MRRVIYLLQALIVFGMMYSNLQAWPYNAKIVNALETSDPPYNPGIIAWFAFGPIEQDWGNFNCESENCVSPPPVFWVLVDWQSPNEPDCWAPMYRAILGSPGIIWFDPYYDTIPSYYSGGKTYLGQGKCGLLGDIGNSCLWYLQPGYNYFGIETGPLISGKYRIRTISINWPNWVYNYALCENDEPNKMLEGAYYYVDDEKFVEVKDQCNDIMRVGEIYYIDSTETRKTYDGGILGVFPRYKSVCMVQATKKPDLMPRQITGIFYPEEMEEPVEMTFVRDPRFDYGECDPNALMRSYAYVSENPFIPYDFWNYDPVEWSSISRSLLCRFVLPGPLLSNSDMITVEVASSFIVKYLNDSTGCFIPAKPEKAKFVILIGDSLKLNNTTRIHLNIEDSLSAIVFDTSFTIRQFSPDLNNYGLPDIPHQAKTVTWNGRCNRGPDMIHLANPEKDPYSAFGWFKQNGDSIASLADSLNVVPKLDSVIVTHMPSYPPPQWMDTTRIYSIAKCKVDDAGNDSLLYYRYYYYSPSATSEDTLWGWDRSSYHFGDCGGRGFFENDSSRQFNVSPWDEGRWGELAYSWFIGRDYAYRLYKTDPQHDSLVVIDTTEEWGRIWNPLIRNNVEWWKYKNFNGHMRLYTWSKVENTILPYTLQSAISRNKYDSHKVILGPNYYTNDIVEWAISHIGTPYFISDTFETRIKKPYSWIDCSGLVTASRIQAISGYGVNTYRLDNVNVASLIRGWYKIKDQTYSTQTQKIDSLKDVGHGDIVAIKKIGYDYSHVAIIDYLFYDRLNHSIEGGYILHAFGGATMALRRVKADELLERFSMDRYRYKFLYFTQ